MSNELILGIVVFAASLFGSCGACAFVFGKLITRVEFLERRMTNVEERLFPPPVFHATQRG